MPEDFGSGNPNFRSDAELCLDLSKETVKPSFDEEISRWALKDRYVMHAHTVSPMDNAILIGQCHMYFGW